MKAKKIIAYTLSALVLLFSLVAILGIWEIVDIEFLIARMFKSLMAILAAAAVIVLDLFSTGLTGSGRTCLDSNSTTIFARVPGRMPPGPFFFLLPSSSVNGRASNESNFSLELFFGSGYVTQGGQSGSFHHGRGSPGSAAPAEGVQEFDFDAIGRPGVEQVDLGVLRRSSSISPDPDLRSDGFAPVLPIAGGGRPVDSFRR
ncbi:MAG: hypothetical protein R2751_12045 [Bacteroidales bacterium]